MSSTLSLPSRPGGLPRSPRPQNTGRSAQGPSYNAGARLRPISPVRSRPEYSDSASQPPRVRSRSQPPRALPSSSHGRSASSSIKPSNERTYRDSGSRGRDRPWPRRNQENRQRSVTPTSRENSPPPTFQETSGTQPSSRNITAAESPGDGYAIWNTVTNAASELTISVTKAWSAKITVMSGEETPPGQESSLTRALKAYHIAKAQKPSDLPDWLFDERERQVVSEPAQPDDVTDDQMRAYILLERDRAPAPNRQAVATSAAAPFNSVSSQPRLRGTDRLRAMRGAKRDGGERNLEERTPSETRQPSNLMAPPRAANPQPRVGLPSGLQRGRR